jgi:hypothetical protein
MGEAFGLTFRVALDGALAWAFVALLLSRQGVRRIRAPLAVAFIAGLLVGAAAFHSTWARGLALSDLAPQLRRLTHLLGLALLAGSFALRNVPGEWAFAPPRRAASEAILLLLALLFLLPQGAHLASLLRGAAVLRGAVAPVALGAALGLGLAAAAGGLLAWVWQRAGFAQALSPSSLFALLFALALTGMGPTALGAHTLPGALTGAIGRALHDGVHLAFVTFQVPDHPFLSASAYQFILFAFEPSTHVLAAIALLGTPLVLGAAASLRRPAPVPDPGVRSPERRIIRARFLRESRSVAGVFALALLILVAAERAEAARSDALYDPIPEPAIDDGAGSVVVPLAAPFGGGGDRMRKFVYSGDGRAVTFFVVRRGDGALVAALDLCEICQPTGYAQMGPDYVFCKYCKTPIPVGTVGQPGGCNPIPIPGAEVKGSLLVIPRAGLVAAWEKGMATKR